MSERYVRGFKIRRFDVEGFPDVLPPSFASCLSSGRNLPHEKNSSYPYWDSLIISSALENDCTVLYAEDVQHGQVISNRLRVLNPFRT